MWPSYQNIVIIWSSLWILLTSLNGFTDDIRHCLMICVNTFSSVFLFQNLYFSWVPKWESTSQQCYAAHALLGHFKFFNVPWLSFWARSISLFGCFFHRYPPKVPSTNKLILARLGVSRPIYVNIDSPNLGFPYFDFLGGYQWKKSPCIPHCASVVLKRSFLQKMENILKAGMGCIGKGWERYNEKFLQIKKWEHSSGWPWGQMKMLSQSIFLDVESFGYYFHMDTRALR